MGRLARFIRFYTDEDDGNGGGKGVLKTVTGALLHIVDALAKPINKFTATLEPIQSGSGDPSPDNVRPITGHTGANVVQEGKNLCDPSTFEQGTINGNSGSENPSTTRLRTGFIYLHSGTYTASVESGKNVVVDVYDTNKNFVLSESYTEWSSGTYRTFTITENRYVRLLFRFSNNATITPQDVTKGQLELGSSATTYEEYTATTIPITFPALGKNLFDEESAVNVLSENRYCKFENGKIHFKNDGSAYCSSTTFDISLAAGTYTLSLANYQLVSGVAPIWMFRVGSGSLSYPSTNAPYVFTLEEDNTVQIRLTTAGTTTATEFYGNVMLEKGSTASTYEEYTSTAYGCTLTFEDGEWKLRVDYGEVDLGSLPCTQAITNTSGKYRFYLTYSGMLAPTATKIVTTAKSDVYASITADNTFIRSRTGIAIRNDTTIIIYDQNYEEDTASTFKQYLQSINAKLVYPLATPIEYTLTETQALTLLKGENNIWVDDSDDLELQYYAKAEVTP